MTRVTMARGTDPRPLGSGHREVVPEALSGFGDDSLPSFDGGLGDADLDDDEVDVEGAGRTRILDAGARDVRDLGRPVVIGEAMLFYEFAIARSDDEDSDPAGEGWPDGPGLRAVLGWPPPSPSAPLLPPGLVRRGASGFAARSDPDADLTELTELDVRTRAITGGPLSRLGHPR